MRLGRHNGQRLGHRAHVVACQPRVPVAEIDELHVVLGVERVARVGLGDLGPIPSTVGRKLGEHQRSHPQRGAGTRLGVGLELGPHVLDLVCDPLSPGVARVLHVERVGVDHLGDDEPRLFALELGHHLRLGGLLGLLAPHAALGGARLFLGALELSGLLHEPPVDLAEAGLEQRRAQIHLVDALAHGDGSEERAELVDGLNVDLDRTLHEALPRERQGVVREVVALPRALDAARRKGDSDALLGNEQLQAAAAHDELDDGRDRPRTLEERQVLTGLGRRSRGAEVVDARDGRLLVAVNTLLGALAVLLGGKESLKVGAALVIRAVLHRRREAANQQHLGHICGVTGGGGIGGGRIGGCADKDRRKVDRTLRTATGPTDARSNLLRVLHFNAHGLSDEPAAQELLGLRAVRLPGAVARGGTRGPDGRKRNAALDTAPVLGDHQAISRDDLDDRSLEHFLVLHVGRVGDQVVELPPARGAGSALRLSQLERARAHHVQRPLGALGQTGPQQRLCKVGLLVVAVAVACHRAPDLRDERALLAHPV